MKAQVAACLFPSIQFPLLHPAVIILGKKEWEICQKKINVGSQTAITIATKYILILK